MAQRTRKEPPAGTYVPEPRPSPPVDGKLSEQAVGAIFAAIIAVTRKVNGGLSLGSGDQSSRTGNLDGQTVNLVTPAVANTEFEVPHDLGRVAQHVVVSRRDRACNVYDSNPGSWNDGRVLLKCDVASASVRLLLL